MDSTARPTARPSSGSRSTATSQPAKPGRATSTSSEGLRWKDGGLVMGGAATGSPADFFAGSAVGWAVFRTVESAVAALGEYEVGVGKSQVAFRRTRGFAYLWQPGRYLRSDVPVVLSLALRHRLDSSRFKEVAHPAPTTWMHHLEVRAPAQIDDEVLGWLVQAYADAA